ncbi:MAG: hypothetical protein AB1722_08255 [Pseudomonadota bacterium]
MRHFYTGLLLFGASCGAHAGEVHKHAHAAKHAPTAMHYTPYHPDLERSSAPAVLLAPQPVVADQPATGRDQAQQRLVVVLRALRDQRMTLHNEQVLLSLQSGSAVIETDHLKVAVRGDNTSITWHKTF